MSQPLIRATAIGVLRALVSVTVITALLGLALILSSGESPIYALISFTTLESPPITSMLASLGAFFLALSGMLMISTIVSYTLTLKTTEDLSRKLEGLEAEVRDISIAALEEAAERIEEAVREAKGHLDRRIEEGVLSLSKSFEDGIRGVVRMLEEELAAIDELIKARVEELKRSLKEG